MPDTKMTRPYKVRTSLEDTKTQLSSFLSKENAIEKAKQNPGYKVFDERTGEVVWEEKTKDFVAEMEVVPLEERNFVEESPDSVEVKTPWYKKLFARKR